MSAKKKTAATPKQTGLDLAAAKSIMTASTPFKQFVIAAGATWPLQQSSNEYPVLRDAYSAAKKAMVQDAPKTITNPDPAAPKAKAPKAAKAPAPAKVDLPKDVIEAIEAEVRSHTVRSCGCGCGVETRASYLPGHDAKLRSRLIAEAKAKFAPKAKAA